MEIPYNDPGEQYGLSLVKSLVVYHQFQINTLNPDQILTLPIH